MTTSQPRRPAYPIEPLFTARWSPRAFATDEIPAEALLALLEAAHWAPSGSNGQPWRFAWARRGTPAFDAMLGTLVPANQAWAAKAAALVTLASARLVTPPGWSEPVPSPSHSFDAGAAWAQLALQAHLSGWAAHAMGGFDREAARRVLKVPDDLQLEVVIAVGRRGDPAGLPEWAMAREQPNDRRPLAELAREGTFGG